METGKYYYYCKTLTDLVTLITERVRDYDCGHTEGFGRISFMVEDTPEYPEGACPTQEEMADAYYASAGAYGIVADKPFDQDNATVMVGYYGGHGVYSFTVDDGVGVAEYLPSLRRQVQETLYLAMLEHGDAGRTTNFIVKVSGG